MSRKQMFEITDDITGEKFYASDDGYTTEPMTVTVNGTEYVNDAAPSTKNAVGAFFNGDTEPLFVLLSKLHKSSKPSNGSVDVAKRALVSAWIELVDGKTPGRVTQGMVDRYDTHLRAEEIKRGASHTDTDVPSTDTADAE